MCKFIFKKGFLSFYVHEPMEMIYQWWVSFLKMFQKALKSLANLKVFLF